MIFEENSFVRNAMTEKKRKYLSESEKLDILKVYDQSGRKVQDTCHKFGLAVGTFSHIKRELWDTYLASKENPAYHKEIRDVMPKSNKLIVAKLDEQRIYIEKKSAKVISDVLDLIALKLDLEMKRIMGDDSIQEKISFKDLSSIFSIVAPYHLRVSSPEDLKPQTLTQRHKTITEILNEQIAQRPRIMDKYES